MTALRAVPNRTGTAVDPDEARADLAPLDTLDSEYTDVIAHATADPEALVLCALMWSSRSGGNADARRITTTLTAADFDDAAHATIFTVIAELVVSEYPHDAASVLTALTRSGSGGDRRALLRRRLTSIVTAGAERTAAVHYADAVLSQSYRRSFNVAAVAMTQAAAELPEDLLFDHLVNIGRTQRAACNRLDYFRNPPVHR